MSRNDSRSTIRPLTPIVQRSLGLCLLLGLAVSFWSSRLAGQHVPPSNQSSNAENVLPASQRTAQSERAQSERTPRPGQASPPSVSSTRAYKPAPAPALATSNPARRDSRVVPASHEDVSETASGNSGIRPDVPSSHVAPGPLPRMLPFLRPATPGPHVLFPAERTVPPQITGSHLGLQPGETATERSLRLLSVIAELEQQNAELTDQITKLNAELKAKDAELQSSVTQISAARKELQLAQEEFQRLRKEIADLREKYLSAEKENASLMRSISPLLKQILQGDDDLATKD